MYSYRNLENSNRIGGAGSLLAIGAKEVGGVGFLLVRGAKAIDQMVSHWSEVPRKKEEMDSNWSEAPRSYTTWILIGQRRQGHGPHGFSLARGARFISSQWP